jgi:hypothetical protein
MEKIIAHSGIAKVEVAERRTTLHKKISGKTCIKLIWKLKCKYIRQAMRIFLLTLH